MNKEERPSLTKVTPHGVVRFIFFLLMAPIIMEESGIITTIVLALLSVEVAIKGDWLSHTHRLTMVLTQRMIDLCIVCEKHTKIIGEGSNVRNKTTD